MEIPLLKYVHVYERIKILVIVLEGDLKPKVTVLASLAAI
jgi:hypothetical protein